MRTCLAVAIAFVPAVGMAQEFTRYPGLSPQQQHLLEPIRTPPPAPAPSPPVQMIEPPARVQSTEPQITQFPGSGSMGSPIDRSERKVPRGLKPGAQDRSKPPPDELTAPPPELMERPASAPNRTVAPQPPPQPATPPARTPPPAPLPPVATAPPRAPLPPATTSLPPARSQPSPAAEPPATAAPAATVAPPQTRTGRPQAQPRPPTVTTAPPAPPPAVPLANQTPSHWQTVTLPPAPDFSRRHEPAGRGPRGEGAPQQHVGPNENAVRALIEADGYRGVSGLTRDAGGVWRGRALRGSTEIGVAVDANGRVSAE